MTNVEQEHRVDVIEDTSEEADHEVRWWTCSCGERDETRLERAHADAAAETHGDSVREP